ncbi:MAG: 3-carboxy-cis,cis-muconate cycloisomerase [Mycobacteriales bacterium]
MRPSSSPSDGLFGPLSASPDIDREIGDRAWLRAMLDAEAALAAAQAEIGLIPAEAAAAIATACDANRYNIAELGERAVRAANPVVPLVADLTAAVPRGVAGYVHYGATSQDILDTAAMLVTRRALGPLLADLDAASDRCACLAATHRDTPIAGRTLLQQAEITTFGLKCAGWLTALAAARAAVAAVRDRQLAVQLGGAAGTLASMDGAGPRVLERYAAALGLAVPVLPWHTDRTRVAALAGALGMVAGVLAKTALDVVLLAQTEVGEVTGDESGGSSALPHKHNPVAAVRVRATAQRVPGLVATLLTGMAQEHERAAGGWQAEWATLTDLLRLTGGAAWHARAMLDGLRVDAARMAAGLTDDLIAGQAAARLAPVIGRVEAHSQVRAAVADGTLRATLGRYLPPDEVAAALDPATAVRAAGTLVDRALAAYHGDTP